MKHVLVIMATFNGAEYLEEQLNSIFSQKNVNVTLLVRDDGSEDRTIDILNKYKKEYDLNWYSGKHLNVARGFLDLMDKAKDINFDYIAFSDQDDVWDLDKLSVAIEQLDTVPKDKPALYYCGQRLVDGKLNLIANHKLNAERSLLTRFVLSDFAGCTGVFNKTLLSAVTEYHPKYILMHDTWVLKVCAALGGNVIVDPEPHMSYRQHGNNSLGLGNSFKDNIKEVYRYIYKYNVESQMRELLRGYGSKIVSPFKELAVDICGYKQSIKAKKKLLDKNRVDFCKTGLNLTYELKIILNKL